MLANKTLERTRLRRATQLCCSTHYLLDALRHAYYHEGMIKSFICKDTEKLYNDQDVKRFRGISRKARLKLEILSATVSLEGLKVPPGNRLEVLKGDRKGQYSIRIDSQWRICFKWENGNVYDVEIIDYH